MFKTASTVRTLVTAGFVVLSSISCEAGGFVSLRGCGALTVGLKIPCAEDAHYSSQFFDTLTPALSPKGAVKTFVLKTAVSDSEKAFTASLVKPLAAGRLTSSFGLRIHPTLKTRKYHPGIDIAAPIGTPIRCSSAGKVSFAGWKSGYGQIVIVDHQGGMQTCYAHCSRLGVKVGQLVSGGQRIALVGKTGRATGPHLHFEIRKKGKAVNPYGYNIRY